MTPEQLSAFQNLPTEQTSASIRGALSQIETAKASAFSRIADAENEMRERQAALTLDSAKRRKLSDAIADQRHDVEMLESLADRIGEPLPAIEAAELRQQMGEELAGFVDEKTELDSMWDLEYPRIAAELSKLVAARDDFIERVRQRGHNLPGIESFEQRTGEGRLPLTSEQREQQRLVEQQAMRQAEDAIRDAAAAIRDAAAARGPRVMPDATPQPTLTVAGVLQSMPGHGW
jgi:hypothetical protein